MKYINQSTEQLDAHIEQMFDLSLSNSAFKRVIPAAVKEELRRQYVEYLNEQVQEEECLSNEETNSRQTSAQVIKVNIAPLREAGFCCCPSELATACETLLRQPTEEKVTKIDSVQSVQEISSSEIKDTDMEYQYDTETTNHKSEEDCESVEAAVERITSPKAKKVYPTKMDSSDEFKKSSSGQNKSRSNKRKYFTKYMTDEFSKDTVPVSMTMMDSKTQDLFEKKEFNELVSEITGIL